MQGNTYTSLTVNGATAELSTTIATLLALEDHGLCIVTLAMRQEPGQPVTMMPGRAALALAVGLHRRLLEDGKKPATVQRLQEEILTAARRREAGTTKLVLEGLGYLAVLHKDMADGGGSPAATPKN